MDYLIEHFLLSQHVCPIPGVGTLRLQRRAPIAHFGENKMVAPVPFIELESLSSNETDFLNFIKGSLGVEKEAAMNLLKDLSDEIIKMDGDTKFPIGKLGVICKDESGKFTFLSTDLPEYLLPSVKLNRVVHPNATHSVRVGDHEHSNQFMTELLSEKEIIRKEKWWIAASFLLFLGLAGLFYSMFLSPQKNKWSNQIPISVSHEPKNYQFIP
jgi:hypothetical protein